MDQRRRRLLAGIGSVGVLTVAGCLDLDGDTLGEYESGDDDAAVDGTSGSGNETDPETTLPTDGPPVTADGPAVQYELDVLTDAAMSGGVEQDDIPSIDNPLFSDPVATDLDDEEPVFGVEIDGHAKAYPQRILVWHEIVNDEIADTPVSVTYCPLTGTAQGFERGSTEFGVSGQLVNSNLIMYDRATESWWPQVLGTCIDGPLAGWQLEEFRVVWTTWGRWLEAHPETEALREVTGYVRNYDNDPYGSYNPRSGYYSASDTLFPPLVEDDREHPKEVVIGSRTSTGAIAFNKELLLEERVLTGLIDGDPYVAVSDPALATGYVYENPDEESVTVDDDAYVVAGETAPADALPLERSLAFDAMWFAWAGFYPETTYVD